MKELAKRRRAMRMPTQLPGSVSGRTPRAVVVRDLSANGCLIHCDTLLEPGAILDLSVELGPDPFTAKVRVTESSLDGATLPEGAARYLVGLEFLALPARAATQLRRFIEDESRRQAPR